MRCGVSLQSLFSSQSLTKFLGFFRGEQRERRASSFGSRHDSRSPYCYNRSRREQNRTSSSPIGQTIPPSTTLQWVIHNFWICSVIEKDSTYCHVPPPEGLQVTVAWGNGWKAPNTYAWLILNNAQANDGSRQYLYWWYIDDLSVISVRTNGSTLCFSLYGFPTLPNLLKRPWEFFNRFGSAWKPYKRAYYIVGTLVHCYIDSNFFALELKFQPTWDCIRWF